jgi:hypothetical protein
MKKNLLIAISLVMALTASAQIQLGIGGGLNFANQILKPTPPPGSFTTLTSFNAGVFVGIPIMKGLTIQPEIMYSGEGSRQPEEDGDTTKSHFNYINVPVLLKYTSSIGIFAEIGPQIGFVVSAKEDDLTNGSTSDIKSYYNTTDFSAVFGVGYIAPFNLGVDFRYNLGFISLVKAAGNYSLKNSVFQIRLFYVFNLKKKSK